MSSSPSPTLAVLELRSLESRISETTRVADRLRDELARREGYQVLSRPETQNRLAAHPDLLKEAPDTLGAVVRQALDDYYNLDFDRSLKSIQSALRDLEKKGYPQADDFDLVGATIVLGLNHRANNDEGRARQAFAEVARLDPDRVLEIEQYPPGVLRLFESGRGEILAPSTMGRLSISSYPAGAEILINGVSKGKTPHGFQEFSQGRHYITLRKEGYEGATLSVDVRPGELALAEKNLRKAAGSGKGDRLLGFEVRDFQDSERQRVMASKIGRAIDCDRIVLVGVKESGWTNRITVRMVDVGNEKGYRPRSVDVADIVSDTPAAVNVLASYILEEGVRVARGGEEAGLESIELSRVGGAKPLYKRPLFWVAVVAIAAGAGTGVGLALAGGDSSPPPTPTVATTTITISGSVPTP